MRTEKVQEGRPMSAEEDWMWMVGEDPAFYLTAAERT